MYDNNHELVVACIQGEEKAWEELWATSGPAVKAIARRLGCNHDEACDVLQMVALVTLLKLGQVRDPAKLVGWIGTIARREAIQVLKDRMPSEQLTPGVALEQRNPEAEVYRAERVVMLRLAMRLLDERCRRMIYELYLKDTPATYKEVARSEHLSPTSVGPIRFRCLKRLRKIMKRLSQPTKHRRL